MAGIRMRDRAGCCASTRCGAGLRRGGGVRIARARVGLQSVQPADGVARPRRSSLTIAARRSKWSSSSRDSICCRISIVNDFECPKISASYGKFAELGKRAEFQRDPIGQRAALGALLADHNTQLDSRVEIATQRPNALCLHLENYGTRSSSLIFMRGDTAEIAHYFAPGPPCRTAYGAAMVPRCGGT